MPYCITCSTKILTLAIAPFLFISVGVICEFAMVPHVYILLSPQEEEVYTLFFMRAQTCTFSSTFKPLRFKHISCEDEDFSRFSSLH